MGLAMLMLRPARNVKTNMVVRGRTLIVHSDTFHKINRTAVKWIEVYNVIQYKVLLNHKKAFQGTGSHFCGYNFIK